MEKGSTIVNLKDLLTEQLRDRYDSAKQQNEFLLKLLNRASDEELKNAISNLVLNNREHLNEIPEIFDAMERSPEGETCEGTKALIHEAMEVISRSVDEEILDVAIAVAVQHLNHHDIAGYRTCRTYAQELGMPHIARALDQMHEDAVQSDEVLDHLLVESLGEKAVHPITEH
jgi:ferritin-like metal-binding protein YciE